MGSGDWCGRWARQGLAVTGVAPGRRRRARFKVWASGLGVTLRPNARRAAMEGLGWILSVGYGVVRGGVVSMRMLCGVACGRGVSLVSACGRWLYVCFTQRDCLQSLQWYHTSNHISVYMYTYIHGLQIVYRGLQVGIQVYRSTESLQKVYRYHTCALEQEAEAQETTKHKTVHHVTLALFVAQHSMFHSRP